VRACLFQIESYFVFVRLNAVVRRIFWVVLLAWLKLRRNPMQGALAVFALAQRDLYFICLGVSWGSVCGSLGCRLGGLLGIDLEIVVEVMKVFRRRSEVLLDDSVPWWNVMNFNVLRAPQRTLLCLDNS